MTAWWTLPGPRRFVRRIGDDLDDGHSVVVAVPTPLADGGWGRRLADAKITRLSASLPAADIRTCPEPLAVVARHLFPPGTRSDGQTVQQACDAAAQAFDASAAEGGATGGLLAVLECGSDWPAWPRWRCFLQEWTRASRNKPVSQRIQFVAVVGGEPMDQLTEDQESLRTRAWDGASDEGDMLAYALLSFADWSGPPLVRRVAAAVAAHLAMWDPAVVDVLASRPLGEVLQPTPLLRELARTRGWHGSGAARDPQWHLGQCSHAGPRVRIHSAFLAQIGDTAALMSRVWAGQVGILLPYVEEQRLHIIKTMRPLLRVPWRTKHGDITDVFDLEIAHLHDQVEHYRIPVSTAVARALPLMRDVRNQLAHLEVIDVNLLSDEALTQLA